MISGPCQETSYTAITLNQESNFTPREKNHSLPIPLKYIDVSRITGTNLDVKQERRVDDYWSIDGSRDFFRFLDRFHSIYLIGTKTSER